MGSWVDDFDSFQVPASDLDFSSTVKQPQTKREKLEAELKLLQWHKLANEAAIKAALVQTKTLKEIRPKKSPARSVEDTIWMKKVIDQERIKPLEVSKDFVLNYEKKEREISERLADHVERHITTLKGIRDKVEQRNDTISRSNTYRTWKKEFSNKKNAVLLGKTLDEVEQRNIERSRQQLRSTGDIQLTEEDVTDAEIDRFQRLSQQHAMRTASSKELATVLDSLHKLSNLENRIKSLETDNAYDRLRNSQEVPDQTPIVPPTRYEFKKQRTPSAKIGGPMGVAYALKPKRKAWQPPIPKKTVDAYRSSVVTGRGKGIGGKAATYHGDQGSLSKDETGFFLTEFDSRKPVRGGQAAGIKSKTTGFREDLDENQRRDLLRRERQRELAKAPAGKLALRNRIQDKKKRQKELELGAKRHEEAMADILRRRQEMQMRKPMGIVPQTKAGKGASSGIRTGNKHMREFEMLKSGLQKKREDFQKKLNANGNINQPFQGYNEDETVSSAARDSSNNYRRMPTTKTIGTATRKTDVLVRRRLLAPDRDLPSLASSPIAVAGIGGLRAIKNNRR